MLKHWICLTVLMATTLCAHGLKIFVEETNSTLHVKTYYSKSAPCQQCDVLVYTDNTLLAQQKSDTKGEIQIPLLAQKLRIIVKASMGHQSEIFFNTDTPIRKEYPVWIKVLLGLIIIITFFGGLKFAKRAQ